MLNTKEAAKYLGLSPYTLERWRYLVKGPRFIRVGGKAVRYRQSALDAFIAEGENG